MGQIKTDWYLTGESRIVPSWFGFMRAEVFWRRDFKDSQTGEVTSYQLKAKSAGSLPPEYDGAGPFGFWSTLATPSDARHGMRAVFRKLVQMFKAPEGWQEREE